MGKINLGEIELTPQQEVETVSGNVETISGNVETLSSTTTAHTADTTVHVTAADKTSWNAKAETSDIPSVTAYADSVKYNSTTHYVEFYHGTTAGTKVYEYDASQFLVDGMVDDVRIENGNLVIDFNTASGKQDISIPLTDIFNPANYYTTAQTSGATELSIAFGTKLDATAYTPTDLSNYYTKSQTSGASEISTALSNKSDTGHTHSQYLTGITSSQVTTALGYTPYNSTNPNGYTTNTGTVTSVAVKMNGSTKGTVTTSGTIDLGTVITSHQDISGKADKATTLAGYGITNAYTKTEIDNKIGDIETLLAAI